MDTASVRARALLAALLGLGAAGCTPRGDVAALAARYPDLAGEETARLADATPYLLPSGDALILFFCRWDGSRPLQVSLPPDATPEERSLLERALSAWQQADLGLRFELAAGARGDIEIRFLEGSSERAGSTGADCLVTPPVVPGAEVLDARLVYASVHLHRTGRNALGRELPFSRAELLGSAVHELGHALGYQGHARRGDAVMVRSVDRVRRSGRELLSGVPFRDDALHALYALPSGVVLRAVPLAEGRSRPVDRISALAVERGWLGPLVRVGDDAARLSWLPRGGPPLGFTVRDLAALRRHPAELALEPDAGVEELLGPD